MKHDKIYRNQVEPGFSGGGFMCVCFAWCWAMCFMISGHALAETIELSPVDVVPIHEGVATVQFDYEREAVVSVLKLALHAVGEKKTWELTSYIPERVFEQMNNAPQGRIQFPIAMHLLPADSYELKLDVRATDGSGDGGLTGSTLIYTRDPLPTGDYEITYRVNPKSGGHTTLFRIQGEPKNNYRSWLMYYVTFAPDHVRIWRKRNTPRGSFFEPLTQKVPFEDDSQKWYDVRIRCEGYTFTANLPPKTTGFWYYGDEIAPVYGLRMGVVPRDEPDSQ